MNKLGPHWKRSDLLGRKVWNRFPESLRATRGFRMLGRLIHQRVSSYQSRDQTPWTRFMRNRPLLEVIATIVRDLPRTPRVKIASIGCSFGAELYSLLYLVRGGGNAPPVDAVGVDISRDIVEQAERARFRRNAMEIADLSDRDLQEMFVIEADWVEVRMWIREGVRWITADARDSKLGDIVGAHDIVLANNFLGPMLDREAESCLENIVRIVRPGGYLVIDGVDLDLKTRFVARKGLKPVLDRVDEINTADLSKQDWPWVRWALEPIDRHRRDWQSRYSTVFQMPSTASSG